MKATIYFWIIMLIGLAIVGYISYGGSQSLLATAIMVVLAFMYQTVLAASAIHMKEKDD